MSRCPSALLSPSLPSPPSVPQKLLGKLCEQNKVVREQDRLVQQLRAEKVRLRVGVVWVQLPPGQSSDSQITYCPTSPTS